MMEKLNDEMVDLQKEKRNLKFRDSKSQTRKETL